MSALPLTFAALIAARSASQRAVFLLATNSGSDEFRLFVRFSRVRSHEDETRRSEALSLVFRRRRRRPRRSAGLDGPLTASAVPPRRLQASHSRSLGGAGWICHYRPPTRHLADAPCDKACLLVANALRRPEILAAWSANLQRPRTRSGAVHSSDAVLFVCHRASSRAARGSSARAYRTASSA